MKKIFLTAFTAAFLFSASCGDRVKISSSADRDLSESETETFAETYTTDSEVPQTEQSTESEYPSLLSSAEDIFFTDVTGCGEEFSFTYGGEAFTALYWTDNWRIIDSFKIRNEKDITIICTVLAQTHPIHSADLYDFRTPEDMAYEWVQHNIAYDIAPDGSSYKESAKDVDIDPKDQGKSVYDLLAERLDLGSLLGR